MALPMAASVSALSRIDAAVGPFDPAVAERDLGLGEHHEAALEAAGAGDLVELRAWRSRAARR